MRPAPIRSLLVLCTCGLLAWAAGSPFAVLARGPYLQELTETSVKLVCGTTTATALTLHCGEHAGPPWEFEAGSPTGTTHVFELDGLRPETRYVYELEPSSGKLAGDASGSFRTAPPAQSRRPFRFLAWGDSGTGNSAQLAVAAAIDRVQPAPDFALLLGDLVYDVGAREDYDWKVFGPYAQLFRHAPFWTALGNHDADTEGGAPYFDAFYLPTKAGAPGHPSDTERYYAFDYGMAHFACVDSQSSSSEPGSPMYTWLQDDLEAAHAAGKRWLIVYMHHPVYSRGTHDSTQEGELIVLHDNLVPLFDAEHVDLVVSGHSHVYERSFLAENDAILEGDEAEYSKINSPDGTVYVVTGCAGEHGTGPLDYPLMARSYGEVKGISVVDVRYEDLRGRFVQDDGSTTDLFTLRKAEDAEPPRATAVDVRAPDELALHFDEPVLAGAGPHGAANPANYELDPPAVVLDATLDSDQSTVVLHTTLLAAERAHVLTVRRVADPAGHATDARVPFVRVEDPTRASVPAVPRGNTWRYREGVSEPPASWNAPGFDDAGWSSGPASFGYGYAVATDVADMQNVTPTLYLRARFTVDDPARVSGLAVAIDFDDGFVAFLNGVEIARANVDPRQTHASTATRNHGAGSFESFDASALRGLLVAGTNVFAVEGHNVDATGHDFFLDPELVTTLDAPGGPPEAVLRAEVRVANAPATIRFSSAGSSDEDGAVSVRGWDFGDGSEAGAIETAEHVYAQPGTYLATLVVADADGNEALAQETIRVHEQGLAPLAELHVDRTLVEPGQRVSFDGSASLDPDGGALTLHWDFGDPASAPDDVASALTAGHAYATSGTYLATLVVTDDEGSGASAEVPIVVARAPTARFSAAGVAGEPLGMRFTDRSTGDVSSWTWDFGDGGLSHEQQPEHTYPTAGDYAVRLTVVGPAGSDDVEQTIGVGTGGGGGGGGGCSVAPGPGPRRADPALIAVLVALALTWLRRELRAQAARTRA